MSLLREFRPVRSGTMSTLSRSRRLVK